jgi:hypothetical protein
VQVRSYPTGAPFTLSSWSPTQTLSAPGHISTDPKVGADAHNNFILVWADTLIGIQSARLEFGGFWSEADDVSMPCPRMILPQIAVSPDGFAVVDWQNQNTSVIQANIFNPQSEKISPTPPSNFQGAVEINKFLNTTERMLTTSWDPSPSPDVVLYQIYNELELVASVSASSSLTFSTCVDDYSVLYYSITAVNDQGIESDHIALMLD